jgi:hypothetical protein
MTSMSNELLAFLEALVAFCPVNNPMQLVPWIPFTWRPTQALQ